MAFCSTLGSTDHHPDPLAELGRLVRVKQALDHDEDAYTLLLDGNAPGALDAVDTGLRLAPGEPDLLVSRALTLARLGHTDDARAIVAGLVDARPGLASLLRACQQRDLLPFIDAATLDSLLS